MSGQRSFVGFGFGPIQSGLFLFEAWRSGRFDRYTVAEVDAGLVKAVNDNGGRYVLSIAYPDRIEKHVIEGVRMLNPRVAPDREALVAAVREADELATALPSVKFYAGGADSVVAVLVDALRGREGSNRGQVLYAAENHNHAAEILSEHLAKQLQPDELARFQIVNTVIGKMSGVLSSDEEIARLGAVTLVPTVRKAILVEAFNRILISRITLEGFERGITVFAEKDDLLPFEEAKLYGHNAVHALLGYLAAGRGLETMAQLREHADLLAIGRRAFLEESGAALIRKYAALGDELFTAEGYQRYADDLLERMVNANLNDRVERVVRDPQRKLGASDRLFGTMRLALGAGIRPVNMALGAAAAVEWMIGRAAASRDEVAKELRKVWGEPPVEAETLIELTWEAMGKSRKQKDRVSYR